MSVTLEKNGTAQNTDVEQPLTETLTVRVPSKLAGALQDHTDIRNLIDDKKDKRYTTSDIVRFALESYLEGYADEMLRQITAIRNSRS